MMQGRKNLDGFTLVETMVVVFILAILASLALPAYGSYVERADITLAMTDVKDIELAIERFRARHLRFPDDLAEIGLDTKLDPWDNPYEYLNIENTSEKDRRRGHTGKGKDKANMRRDKNLKPINSDYDLYSKGKDGESKPQLNAKPSRDDIVRGADGSFVGLGKDF